MHQLPAKWFPPHSLMQSFPSNPENHEHYCYLLICNTVWGPMRILSATLFFVCSCSWVIESDTVPAIMQRVPIDGGACKVHRLFCPTNKKDHKSTQSEELLSPEPISLESDLLETRCLAGFAFALAATTAG